MSIASKFYILRMQAAAALEAEMAEEGGYPVRERSQSPDKEKRKREKWRKSRSRERCFATPHLVTLKPS